MALRSLLASLLSFLVLALQAPAAGAQGQVQAELYARLVDGKVEAAIRLAMAPGWHLYHEDLGHPDAVGRPTTVALGGEGIAWGTVAWPEPERLPQEEIGPGVTVLAHEGTIVLRASGVPAAGRSDAADVTAEVTGLVCETLCIPYRARLRSQGPGPDELFATSASASAPAAADAVPAADEVLGGKADATLYTRREGERVHAALVVRVEPGWHLYHDDLSAASAEAREAAQPTSVTLRARGVRFGPVHFPSPHRLDQGWEDAQGNEVWLPGHEGEVVLWAEGTVEGAGEPGRAHGEIHGQTCSNVCLQYDETFVDAGRGDDALFAGVEAARAALGGGAPAGGPSQGGRDDGSGTQSLLAFLLLAVGGGLFALLMPCTYPMVPITISFFTKQAHARGGKVLSLALLYGAGIVLMFVAIGVLVGPVIIRFAANPITNVVIGALFFLFALALFGVINLEPPRQLMNAASRASTVGGLLGVFLMGATLVVTSFTCTAPVVGAILGLGGSGGDTARLVLGMATFGATMAAPFVLLSLLPGRLQALPRSGEWMNTLKHFLGFVELAAALKFFSNSDIQWRWNVLSRELFLAAWALVFALAGIYLLGFFHRPRERVGRLRAGGAALSLVFAVYCFVGMLGRPLDYVMTAIAPPYSGGALFPQWYRPPGEWTIVLDDYDQALQVARADEKLLLVNFTGLTCVNCRAMENKVFPSPPVADVLHRSYVEARLHTDGTDHLERILALQKELTGSVATPVYVLVDPRTGEKKGQFLGSTFDAQAFAEFLGGAP